MEPQDLDHVVGYAKDKTLIAAEHLREVDLTARTRVANWTGADLFT